MKFFYLIAFVFSVFSLKIQAQENKTGKLQKPEVNLEQTEITRAISSDNSEGKDTDVEKIKVTGSRISRIDIEGPSPLIVYDKEALENSGYSSAGDFLRDTTISHFGVTREEAGSSLSGESFASVKGEASLILINGVRVTEDPNVGAVDLNLIPLFAIERVEILKDGASALYGSDAVGGVINFIIKKEFSGIEIHSQVAPTFYKGGSRADTAIVFGKKKSKSSFMGTFHFRFQDSVENSEREWTNKTISPVSPYGVFGDAIDPNCPEELKTPSGCKFNVADYSTRYPLYGQLYTYLQGDYKFGETTFYSQLIASYKHVKWSYAPIPGGLKIPANHQMSFGQGQAGTLRYRFMEAGQRDTLYKSTILDLTVGAKGYLSPTWDYDLNLKPAIIVKTETAEGLLLKEQLTEAIVNASYDPFNPEKRNLSNALYIAESGNVSSLLISSLDLSGESGFWDIDLATGFQAYFKNFLEKADRQAKKGRILSNAGSDGYGERYVASYYLEGIKYLGNMEVQLAGRMDYYSDFGFTANPKLAIRLKPSSQILLRGSIGTAFVAPSLHDLYQSESEGYPFIFDTVACYNELKNSNAFAEIYNQKEKEAFDHFLKSSPEHTESIITDSLTEQKLVKGSLIDQKDKEAFVKDFLIEQKEVINQKNLSSELKEELTKLSKSFSGTEYCQERQVFSKGNGNKNLKETKAIIASLGSHLQISEDHSLTLDIWYIRKNGIPSSGLGKKTIDAELKYGNEYVKEKGITVNRDEGKTQKPLMSGPEHGIVTKLLNLGSSQKTGLDLSWNSNFDNYNLFGGNPYFINNLSYIMFSKAEDFPGIGYVDGIGKFEQPRWRNITSLGWRNNQHNFSISAYTTASTAKASSELENLPLYARFDMDYQYMMNEQVSFKFGWSNVLFSTPPIDEEAPNNKIDHSIFESRGPFLFAGLKYKF